MTSAALLWGTALGFYGLANILFPAGLWLRKKTLEVAANASGFAGMAVQAAALALIGVKFKVFPILNLHDSLGLFSFLIMGAYFAARVKWPLAGMGFFAATLAFLASLGSYAFPAALPHPAKDLSGVVLDIHISIMILSFAAFALAFCACVAYLLQDVFLRSKHNIQLARRLPPLNALDWLINRLVEFGFVSLTLGMALGSVWADRWWGSWWNFDPKQTLALITWLVYAYVIHARTLSGWKGKKLVMVIVLGFVLVVVTFIGTNFLPGKHKFT